MIPRTSITRARRVWLIVGLVLAPLIVAVGVLWAVGGRDGRLGQIQAAIVNQDTPVEIDGQTVPLGRQLASELIASAGANVSWVLTDAPSAQQGLSAGTYAAVVTIPSNFSAAATSFGGKPDAARRAVIDISTSKTTGVADTNIGRSVAESAARTLSTSLTENYLDRIYLGFNEMGQQFVTVADRSRELSAGATKLANGITSADQGTRELADGLTQLATNGPKLTQGTGDLVTGVRQLAAGADKTASGAQALSGGLGELSLGAQALSGGLSTLAEKMPALTDGATQLNTGARQLAAGLTPYTDGVSNAASGATKLAAGMDMFHQVLQTMPTISAESLSWVDTMQPTLEAFGPTLRQIATGVATADKQLAAMAASGTIPGLPAPAIDCPPVLDPAGCQAFQAGVLAGQKAGVIATATATRATLHDPALTGGVSMIQAVASLEESLPRIGAAMEQAKQLMPQLKNLPDQLTKLKAAVADFAQRTAQLRDGLNTAAGFGPGLAAGAHTLAGHTTALTGGLSELATGINQAATGARQLNEGLSATNQGARPLAAGIGQLSDGLRRLNTGADTLATGVQEYTAGVGSAADGGRKLATGMAELTQGGSELATGSTKLADGLAEGATKVPSYSASARQSLKAAVANPIQISGEATSARIPATALLIALTLWFAGLACYLLLRPVPADTLTSSRPSWQLMLRASRLGATVAAAGAVAVTITAALVLQLSLLRSFGLAAFILLAAVAFFAVNHALSAWWPGFGRLLALALAVISFVWALTTAAPSIFGYLAPLSPVTAGISGIRAIAAGSTAIIGPIAGLLGWLVLGLLGTAAAVARGRSVRAKQLLAASS